MYGSTYGNIFRITTWYDIKYGFRDYRDISAGHKNQRKKGMLND